MDKREAFKIYHRDLRRFLREQEFCSGRGKFSRIQLSFAIHLIKNVLSQVEIQRLEDLIRHNFVYGQGDLIEMNHHLRLSQIRSPF